MRKTREQSRQETRQRLIAAGQAAIVREGIGALSLRGVCEEAGYSQGAFYSNFSSRDELLLTIMELHIHAEVEVLRNIVQFARQETLGDLLSAVAERLASTAKDTQWSLLAIELQLHAQRDAQFSNAYNDAKAGYHTEFALLVDDITSHFGLTPALPSLQIAIGLYALWSGLVVQGTVPGALPRDQIFLAFLRAIAGPPHAA